MATLFTYLFSTNITILTLKIIGSRHDKECVHSEKYAFLKVFEDYQRVPIMWAELQKEKMENKTFRIKS